MSYEIPLPYVEYLSITSEEDGKRRMGERMPFYLNVAGGLGMVCPAAKMQWGKNI